jgi:hypothetical protein
MEAWLERVCRGEGSPSDRDRALALFRRITGCTVEGWMSSYLDGQIRVDERDFRQRLALRLAFALA